MFLLSVHAFSLLEEKKKKRTEGRKQQKGWSNKKPDMCKNWKTVSNGKL